MAKTASIAKTLAHTLDATSLSSSPIGAWMMSFSRLLRRAARNETATAVAAHSKYSFDPS